MSEDYLAQAQPTQSWNTARGVWEKQGIANLLCEHWELFSETWQTSGLMRNGKVYELPTLGPHTTDSESSLSPTQDTRLMPTPNTMDHLPARTPEAKALNKGKGGYANVRETVVNDLMPTPKARDSQAEGYEAGLRRATPQVGTIVKGLVDGDPRVLIPTPTSRDYKDGQSEHERKGVVQTDTVSRAIFNSGEVLLPTTTASDWKGPNHSGSGSASSRGIATAVGLMPTPTAVDMNTVAKSELDANDPKHRLKVAAQVLAREGTQWGKFEPAIRRWEQTLGRPSPLPTKPDGKDGAHRLSSAFTEWMMGLPTGWVTGVGLTRNEELKACGNGVVPQQAELALRSLLQGVTLPTRGGQVNLPTPTVSDIYTDNLKSSQQKEGSMHSVTLPQAVRMVSDRIEAGPELFTPTLQTDDTTIGRDNSTAEDRQ